MCNKILGLIALFGAPFLCIDFLDNQANTNDTWTTGLFGFIYMVGWMASVVGLMRLNATGKTLAGRCVLVIQLILLCIAQVFNIDVMIHGGNNSLLQQLLDIFWPISNGFMLITGVAVLFAKQLKGWQKWVPVLVGSWLPVMLLSKGFQLQNLYFAGFYSAIAWTLLAIVIYTAKLEMQFLRKQVIKRMARAYDNPGSMNSKRF
ncbi:MAG: hypothetical protein ACJ749_04235 [Flavisolibacter sp.]